jgi:Ni/Fe-hydrogenase subunit HybB-like protein
MPHWGLVLACLIILNDLGAFVLLPAFLSIFEFKLIYFPEGGEKEKP